MTSNSGGEIPDKLAIADKVIVSAGEILAAAGFDREEIASFFRQAAEHLVPQADGGQDYPAPELSAAIDADSNLMAEFAASPPVQELEGLHTQAAGLGPPASDARFEEHINLAMRMVPLIAEAQDMLRSAADNAGLRLAANRRDWDTGPAEGAPTQPPKVLFIEDFESAYAPSIQFITSLIGTAVVRRDERAFTFLLERLFENGVIITHDLKLAMEQGLGAFLPDNP